MNLLIVTDAYPPEIRSSSHLMIELAEGLRDLGHGVTVLTGWPGYNLDKQAAERSFEPSMMEDGVHVIRIKTLSHHNVGFLKRGIVQLTLPFQFLFGLKRYCKDVIDGVIVYSPPLPLSFVGERLRTKGSRYVLNVQDIFPQNAMDLGALTNPALVGFFRWMERRAYRKADVVTAHSEGNRAQLAAANPESAQKLQILHNWVDSNQFAGLTGGEDFRETYGLQGKYILVYGGVIGPAQGLEVILDIAARLRDMKDVVFLVVGEGLELPPLQERVARENLTNVVFKPFVSRERYPHLLQSSDAGFLTLNAKMKTPVVPGKLLGYMAAGLPAFAFVNRESDAHPMIAEAGCGFSCTPNEVDKAAEAVRNAYNDRNWGAECGRRGQEFVRAKLTRDAIVGQIATLLTTKNV
jgi:colanic acid biosynthesis glycosyl transferase WcaI